MVALFLIGMISLILSEWLEEPIHASTLSKKNKNNEIWGLVVKIIVIISVVSSLALSLYNFMREPPQNIYTTYE